MKLDGKHIVLGVSGSIAAYKAAELASLLIKAGARVTVIETENATQFVAPLTFESLSGEKCLVDTFDRNFQYSTEHVAIAKSADAFIIAPASADVIAKAAYGLADDMLTTTLLACSCPKIVAPAMNTGMYRNPVTKRNIDTLRELGFIIADPVVGRLACGDVGEGKMAEPKMLLEYIRCAVTDKSLQGRRVLVSAGPTVEAIDPVRFITNHSTGTMGYELASEAARRGAVVTLVSGPVSLPAPPFMDTVNVGSAAEMSEAVLRSAAAADIVIMAAAVADYRPAEVSSEKIKKTDDDLTLRLTRTNDILRTLGERKRAGQYLCGFAMETSDLIARATAKLTSKHADMIVANSINIPGSGFGTGTNKVYTVTKDAVRELPVLPKSEVAGLILDAIEEQMK